MTSTRFSVRQTLLQCLGGLALLALSQSAWSMYVSPSPSTGTHTIYWSTPLGCTQISDYPYYETVCYSLQENYVDIASSGTSLQVSRSPGTYTYQVYYVYYVAGQVWDAAPIEGPVSVNVVIPANIGLATFTSAYEGDNLVYAVTRSTSSGTHSVAYEAGTAGGSTIPGDFTATSGTLTFNPGETTKYITVPTTEDSVYEVTEQVYMYLSSPSSGVTITENWSQGVLYDDDSAPTFTINDISVGEGGLLSFTVTKSGATAVDHTVNWAAAVGTAGTADFQSWSSGEMTFAPGQTTGSAALWSTQDSAYENTERMYVNLSNSIYSNGATIADPQGYGDITNDDAGPRFTIDNASIGEGGTLSFTVTKTGSSELSHDVSYATATDTAGAGDFTAVSSTLSFASGDTTKTVNVSTTQDSLYESTERLNVNLSSATNGATIDDPQGYGDITNDDLAPSFSINDVSVGEGGTLSFTVTKTGLTQLSHDVNYATATGTAGSGDFTAASSTLSFASGDTTKTVNVSTTQDSTYESTERLNVNLSSATNGATIGDPQGYGDITNDDSLAAPGTPSGPTGNEYTGAYTITWSGVADADNYRLEERFNGGSWSQIHDAIGTSKAVSGKAAGAWEYRVRACNNAIGGCSGYSGTKTVTVAIPAAPGTPSVPSYSYGSSYTVTWSGTTGAATYTLQERVNGGTWTTIHDAAGTSKSVSATSSESTRDYQVRACSGAGCSSYSGIATVSVVLPPATTGATPGAIPGGFSVGTQGEASYSIPITVPAGTGGLKPSLALSYNHLAGNGLAGMRWTLSGISAITLCSKTVAQDGEVALDAVYCLNGQRLVNFVGDYYAADTEYRTEIESFQRIKQVGSGSSTSFYVDHGNGLRSYLGDTTDSRAGPSGGAVRTWYISHTIDQFGNRIDYSYSSPTANQTLLQTVEWTRNAGQSLDPHYAVTITYEDRPSDDQRIGYDGAGGFWQRTKRIDEIAVTYDDGSVQPVATYALTYASTAPPSGTGRSQLANVSVCRGSECLPETLFTTQNGDSGWGTAQATGSSAGSYPIAGDWNGDGRTDLFVSLSNHWKVHPGKANGLFDTTVDTGLSSTTNPDKARVFDYNGDGLADLLYQDGSSNWKVAPSNGTTGFGTSIDTGVATSSFPIPILQDHDGDGLADWIYVGGASVGWLRNLGNGSFASPFNLYTATGAVQTYSVPTVDAALRSLDANGDGRADLIVEFTDRVYYNPSNPCDYYDTHVYQVLLANGDSYVPIDFDTLQDGYYDTNFRIGDFNGDGLSDILYINQDSQWSLMVSTGASFVVGGAHSVPTTNAAAALVADYDGDGRDDLLRPDGNYWYIHRAAGGTLPGSYSATVGSSNAAAAMTFIADVAGSGYPEIVRVDSAGTGWAVHPRNSTLTDVVTDFTDGLDRTVSVEYESLAQTTAYTLDPGHTPSASYDRRYGGPRYVVTTETHDDGVGATRDFLHTYDTAFVNAAGRGWQAFYKHTIKDVLQDTYTQTTYNQSFPTAGMAESVTLATVGADHSIGTGDDGLIRSVDPEPTATAITGTTPQRQFVRVEQTTIQEKEVGGTYDGVVLRTVVENPVFDATYGYVTSTTRSVTQPGVTGSWVTTTNFDRGVNDVATTDLLCRGLPDTVVTSSTLPGGSPVYRTVEYDFNGDCTLDQITDLSETSDTKQLRREFGYDFFGNVASVSEYAVGASSVARTTTFDFDADGHFPESVTVEGVELTTTLQFDPLLGKKTSVTSPDGLTTSFEYDAFGRLINETRPAGYTDVSYHVCASGGCFSPNAAFYVQAADSTGATSYTFLDAFERPVGSDTPLAGGRRSRARTVYQSSGRVDKHSLPYVAGDISGIHWVTMTYDALGRPLTESDESGASATYAYLGHALNVTDAKNHTTHYEHNALGQIEEVVDAMNGTTAYTYYPFGELHTVTDDDLNETEILYDARGLKKEMLDPDMGHWYYTHNAFGDLATQTDAKNQTVTLDYDAAGRLESRNDGAGETTLEYYPYNASAGQAGRLKKMISGEQLANPGDLKEELEYDSTKGTVKKITRTIGSASYVLDFAYDTHGRLSQITYPQNVHSQRLAVEYVFDGSGVLSQVRNAGTPSTVYYTLNEQDGSGAVRKATLGNGIVEQYGYEATTGELSSIKAGLNGSAALQNLQLEWDLAGNLGTRRVLDANNTVVDTDVIGYDALDRLSTVTRNSSQIFGVTYDALGNIQTKTAVTGTYTYGGSRPHAVTAIGSMTFGYDANGNMTNRNGTTLEWTPDNLPSHIERASGEYSDFLYGADRTRYVQVEGNASTSTTRHYASPGLFEVLYDGSSRVDYHYIHANGRAVAQITMSSGGDETQYLHRDHLGSVVATTATNGTVLDRFEYDPFGVRTTTASGSAVPSHRGYTGHEHLEALDLVHMNGRVQDPLLGRFLSPDPIVQAPYHSQSLNRYSYVWNNPLSLVDPSGFKVICADNGSYCGDECWLNPAADGCQPPGRDNNQCSNFVDRCISIDAYRQQQEWEEQTQYLKDSGGSCTDGCHHPPPVVAASADDGLGWVDRIHLGLNTASIGLDAIGIGGTVSWIPDVADGIVSVFEGDWKGAGMSIASAIPFGGIVANGAKMARVGEKALERAGDAARAVRKAPAPNNGIAKQHGGTTHNQAIDDRVGELQADQTVSNIRKNQQQADVNGNKVGTNRPDLQYDQCGVHHCVEYDNIPDNSTRHGDVIRANDPNARVDLNVL